MLLRINQLAVQFGSVGDIPVPKDYDGDGKTDIAVFHPSTVYWDAFQSSGLRNMDYYTYDAGGDILQIQDWRTTETQTFGYDALDRLTSAAATRGSAPYAQTYGYNPIGNMLSKNSTTYTYGNSAHKHAVTSLGTGESYTYDANGNTLAPDLLSKSCVRCSAGVITRVEGGLTYTQSFNVENRLVSVTVSGQVTQFLYDPDGNLVKKINPNGSKTLYVGGIYEVDKNSGGTVTGTKTYYPEAGAMRVGSTLYYVLKDHLGSASMTTDSSGGIVGEQGYYPFGQTRFTINTMLTDKLFTGQREITGLGIYSYGARFYSPYINRFLSADTVVPGYANPQSLNRFSYVLNNPLRYTDPTGHMVDNGCSSEGCSSVSTSNYCATHPAACNYGGGGGSGNGGNGSGGGGGNGGPHSDENDSGLPTNNPIPDDGGGCTTIQWGEWGCYFGAVFPESSHDYTLTNIVCPASWHCTQQQMIYYLSLFAYPGQDPLDGPVQTGHHYSVDWPLTSISMGSLGAIQVTVTNGGWTTTNITDPSHILYNGRVVRTLSHDVNGNWIVTTHGYGTNTSLLLGEANQVAGPQIFEAEDINMTTYIYDQKFPNSNYITK